MAYLTLKRRFKENHVAVTEFNEYCHRKILFWNDKGFKFEKISNHQDDRVYAGNIMETDVIVLRIYQSHHSSSVIV